jgi:lipopolysaccharide transport system ATP-binding protein
MAQNAILVENLSKRYLIGHQSAAAHYKYAALRDVIAHEARKFARRAAEVVRGRQVVQGDEIEDFWALKDVSFEVKQGDILGIVGRNGAGKSTLLKILSRITEPTQGRITLRGRVSSLLEVGTGFHPELTGRENIFLNGAILGMTQREIRKKFDEIVAFAEVEKFIDTPVKHYSSGMYVRLAFAVAAHLEPEILIVDEVLAVGDAEFQKKCLGKMDEVSRSEGRTILFVSHNMDAVLRLCTRGIFFEAGAVRTAGDIKAVVSTYLQNRSRSQNEIELLTVRRDSWCTGKARIAKAVPSDMAGGWSIPFGHPISVNLTIEAESTVKEVVLAIPVFSIQGFEVATWSNKCNDVRLFVRPGANIFKVTFHDLRLLPGQYSLGISVHDDRGGQDYIHDAVSLEVVPSDESARINAETFNGAFVAYATVSALT